jgi:GR25 family glycosyltransferase involved in LPS biosynthesis
MLNFLNLSYSRFSAIDGKKILNITNSTHHDLNVTNQIKISENKSYYLNKTKISTISSGQFGCWLSYLTIMKNLVETKSERPTLILEDDVDLEVDFMRTISTSTKTLPSDWDMLLCGYCCLTKQRGSIKEFYHVKKYATTHCQLIRNYTTAARIYEKLNLPEIEKPVDMIFHDMAALGYLKIFALKNQIAIQRRDLFKSDIEFSWNYRKVKLKNSLTDLL